MVVGISKSAFTTCSTPKRASVLSTAPADVIIVLYKYHPHGGGQKDAVRLARELSERGVTTHIYVNEMEGEAPEGVTIVAFNEPGLQNHTRHTAFRNKLAQRLKDGLNSYVVGFVRTTLAAHYVAVDPCFKNRIKRKRPLWLAELNPRDRAFLAEEEATLTTGKRRFSFLTKSHFDDFASAYPIDLAASQILPLEVRADCKRTAESESVRKHVRGELGFSDQDLVLLAVGSGFKTKGLDRSIQTLRHLREKGTPAHLIVAGNDDKRAFERLARRIKMERFVRFLGGRDDVAQLYCGADLLLHPARAEAGGKVLLEALAAGVAVLTTDVCGYADAVKHSGGGIVLPSPFQQRALNEATASVVDIGQRTALAEKGVEFTRELGSDDMIEALADEVQRGLRARSP